ncbi:hypothetical protein [Selenomonas flueggei]|uniref:hypothetical protein n=1 Tax=Selenomonas flueggei TaxID=135080 RepID=UPI002673F43D|nr:hypothetical protein [Selenomonas flueggei]
MAQFPILKLTHAGQDMAGMSQGGGKLIFVRVELGDGQLVDGDSIETLTAIKHSVMQLPLQSYLNEGGGKARLRFVVDNSSLEAGFINREIGVYAKMEGGEEQLYAYTNAGNYADWIPSKETPIDGDIVDLHIIIGNAPNVVIETINGAYATKNELEEHNKAPDAHADIRRILDDKAPIASPALTGTPTVPTASKGTSTDQIASTAFVSQAIADADAKVSERALKIAILTGTVAGGETIPLPDGYTEDQCKWIVSVRTKQVDDDDTITCHTDEHRVVTCWTYQRGNKGTVNYMIIGVK